MSNEEQMTTLDSLKILAEKPHFPLTLDTMRRVLNVMKSESSAPNKFVQLSRIISDMPTEVTGAVLAAIDSLLAQYREDPA